MPIDVDSDIQYISERLFHTLAEEIIGITFDVHNDFGRLLNEAVYKRAIKKRCTAAGIEPVRSEVKITVRRHDFRKSFYMDLLLAQSLMVETKAVETLSNVHHAQAIQYLLLTGMKHGLMVNLRPGKVEKQFISTTLQLADRRRYSIDDSNWDNSNESSERLRDILRSLLDDWGAFLTTNLYRDAIIHFWGGREYVLREVPIYDGDVQIGSQEVCLLQDDRSLAITSLKTGKGAMSEHLHRFLNHTKLHCVQWINMDNHNIELRSIAK